MIFENIFPFFYAVAYPYILHSASLKILFLKKSICFKNSKTKKPFLFSLCFHTKAATCSTALINLKCERRRYNRRSQFFTSALNLTCCHTLMILSLYRVKNAGVQPSPTDGAHHKNLVLPFLHLSTFRKERSAGRLFPVCATIS